MCTLRASKIVKTFWNQKLRVNIKNKKTRKFINDLFESYAIPKIFSFDENFYEFRQTSINLFNQILIS